MTRFALLIAAALVVAPAAQAFADEPASAPASAGTACDNYDVGLTLRRIFMKKSPSEYGSIVSMWNVREIPGAPGARRCSAELLLNRSWMKSNHVYVEWTVTQITGSTAYVQLAHMEDL
jgi:hypothetical protein